MTTLLETVLEKAPLVKLVCEDQILEPENERKGLQPDSNHDNRYGLAWKETFSGPTPFWTAEPDVEIITRLCKDLVTEHLAPRKLTDIKVQLLDQGAFNRIFKVTPNIRTLSTPKERADTGLVSGTERIRHVGSPQKSHYHPCSTDPSPGLFQSEDNNPLRFEWMLQKFMPGQQLEHTWNCLNDTGRQHIIRQLADLQTQLFHMQKAGIGSLHTTAAPGSVTEMDAESYRVGPIATMQFFVRNQVLDKQVNRGPFKSSREWLTAQLDVAQCENTQLLEEADTSRGQQSDRNHSEADNEREDDTAERAQEALNLIKRLLLLLPHFIPETATDDESSTEAERSILAHHDLSRRNILVDTNGTITAILDWECTACLPAWAACDLPCLLEGQTWDSCAYQQTRPWASLPDPKEYGDGEDEEMYKEHLLEHQLVGLRELFFAEMKAKCPEWTEIYERSRVQRDFHRAVGPCDYELVTKSIHKWLDTFEENGFAVGRHTYVPLDLKRYE